MVPRRPGVSPAASRRILSAHDAVRLHRKCSIKGDRSDMFGVGTRLVV